MHIRLSPSTIALAKECARCFWLAVREKVRRPSGPFPSLPSGMDNIIKSYFDSFRVKGQLPPEIEGKIEGQLFPDLKKLNQWRNWRTGLSYTDESLNATLSGALDDVLVDPSTSSGQAYYLPLDYKTRGYALKEDAENYYQHQLDLYSLLLEENGMPTKGVAYLLYFHPVELLKEGPGLVRFEVTPKREEASVERARELFVSAVKIAQGEIPRAHTDCAFCSWGAFLGKLE